MNSSRLLALVLLSSFAACDRRPSAEERAADRVLAEQRQADDARLAELRELERKANKRELEAQSSQNEEERRKLASERADLERSRAQLALTQSNPQIPAKRVENEPAGERAGEQQIDFFYRALERAGDWFELGNYGYVWQPAQARDSHWRPYTDGSWVWSEYGWTWASNEDFGWATYHYGRWARVHRVGWVWVPGSEWAPAWVSWRRSDQFVGWAPLPPEAHSASGFNAAVDRYYDIGPSAYSFVPVESFGDATYVGRAVEPERNVTIINQTVNVTQVTYKTVDNRTAVFNAGPDLNLVQNRSKQPVRELRVEKSSDLSSAGPATVHAKTLRLTAPSVAPASKATTAPSHSRPRIAESNLDRGWGGSGGSGTAGSSAGTGGPVGLGAARNPQAESQIRAQFAREAEGAENAQRTGKQTVVPKPAVAAPVTTPAPLGLPAPALPKVRSTPNPAQSEAAPVIEKSAGEKIVRPGSRRDLESRKVSPEVPLEVKPRAASATPVQKPESRVITPPSFAPQAPEKPKSQPSIAPTAPIRATSTPNPGTPPAPAVPIVPAQPQTSSGVSPQRQPIAPSEKAGAGHPVRNDGQKLEAVPTGKERNNLNRSNQVTPGASRAATPSPNGANAN